MYNCIGEDGLLMLFIYLSVILIIWLRKLFFRSTSMWYVADSMDFIISIMIRDLSWVLLLKAKLGDNARTILTSWGKGMSVRLGIQSSWKEKSRIVFRNSLSNLLICFLACNFVLWVNLLR